MATRKKTSKSKKPAAKKPVVKSKKPAAAKPAARRMPLDTYVSSGRFQLDTDALFPQGTGIDEFSNSFAPEDVNEAVAALDKTVRREYLALYKLAIAGQLPALKKLKAHCFGPAERYDDGEYADFEDQRELIESALGIADDGAGIEYQLVAGGRVMKFDTSAMSFEPRGYGSIGECMWFVLHQSAVAAGVLTDAQLKDKASELGIAEVTTEVRSRKRAVGAPPPRAR